MTISFAGLSVFVAKCRLWAPLNGTLPRGLLPQIPRLAAGLHVLGVPFGDDAALALALDDAYTDWCRALDELPLLGDPQVARALLRQSAAARPRYLQRVLQPTPEVLALFRRFDRRLRGVAADLLGIEINPLDDSAD